jgi:hypothetical protein
MGASLNGVLFRNDPDVISWDFKPKVSAQKTVGGKVVQVYGIELGDLVVHGAFGRGGRDEQSAFLNRMKAIGDNQMDQYPAPPPRPHRFFWPERKWDMLVWLKSYTDGGFSSVTLANEQINPKWELTFHIVEDNSGLKKIAADAYIERLSAGLGWQQTEFNGPMDVEEMARLMMAHTGASNVTDYLNIAFERGVQTPVGNVDAGTSTTAPTDINAIQQYTKDEAAKKGWTGAEWDALYELVKRESSWNPNAANPSSSARGLFQKMTSIHGPIEPTYQGQVAWGLNYIKDRYGTPSAALAFHNANNSY